MKVIQAFKCSHCGKIYADIEKCITHEKFCAKNANKNLSCKDCDHRKKVRRLYDKPYLACEYNRPMSRESFLRCPYKSFTM